MKKVMDSRCEINILENRYEILYLTEKQTSVMGSLYIFKKDMKKFVKDFNEELDRLYNTPMKEIKEG